MIHRTTGQALAAALAIVLAGCGAEPAARPHAAALPPQAPVPTVDAELTLAHNPDGVRYAGRVGDAATRDLVVRALRATYGDRASGSLAVDPSVRPAPWASGLAPFLAEFTAAGAMVRFVGDRIELAGAVDDTQRAALRQRAQTLFPRHALTGLFAETTETRADAASPDAAALLARLNALDIRFESESAMVAADSLDALTRAARALKRHPDPVRIGVYPEISDHPEFDRSLARKRAEAVKVQLVIQGLNPGHLQTEVLAIAEDARERAGKVEFAVVR